MGNIQKLSNKTRLGYGAASMADALAYNFVLMFFVYFLTDAAGISPAIAGTIAMIATLWDAVNNPLIGQISDNTKSKYGRRRPFLLISSVPLALGIILMFSNFDMVSSAKTIYFIIITIVFWTSYTCFYIPYTSLGAEITDDYNERTKLRMPATIFNYLGNILGMSAPLYIVSVLMNNGASLESAWNKVAILVAVASFITIMITWRATRGKEKKVNTEEINEGKKEKILKVYSKVIRLKPYKYLMAICLLFIFAYTIYNANLLYFIQYKMGLTEADASKATLIFIIVGIVMVPIITFIGTKIDKKTTVAYCFAFSAILMIAFKFIGIEGFTMLVIYMLIFGVANCAYWQMIPSIIYDMCEVYEYKYGERREGAVTALAIFAVKVGSALALWSLGFILEFTGYDGEAAVQSESAIKGIENAFTIIPGAIFIVAVIILLIFPVTKKSHEKLLLAIKAKKEGKKASTEGLERII